jgi:hypothetical protein
MNKFSNKEEIVQYFLDHPAQIRENKSKWVSDHYKIDIGLVREAYKEAKELSGIAKSKKKTAGEYIGSYLDKHNLELSDVKNIKIYGNPDKPLLSIATKNEWYKDQENFLSKFIESVKDYKAPVFKPVTPKGADSLAILNLYDAHIDKLNLIDETNPKGSVDDNVAKFEDAFDKLLSQTLVYSPEHIIFPVGNDFFNSNDARNTTKKGTPQDTNPFWKQSFIKGFECIRRCVDKANQFANVYVIMVISNHDEDKLFYLGQLLKTTYENSPNVFVDDSTKARKYFQYGNTLLGFSHGDKEKNFVSTLPATIMIENKKIMPEIDFIHHYCGDIHHIEKFQVKTSQDLKGCNIKFLRPLSDLSKWEYEQGYVGVPKTAESDIFKKGEGLKANLQVHI